MKRLIPSALWSNRYESEREVEQRTEKRSGTVGMSKSLLASEDGDSKFPDTNKQASFLLCGAIRVCVSRSLPEGVSAVLVDDKNPSNNVVIVDRPQSETAPPSPRIQPVKRLLDFS